MSEVEHIGPYRTRLFGHLLATGEASVADGEETMDVNIVYQGRAAFGSILLHHRVEPVNEAEFERMVETLVIERRTDLLRFLASCMQGEASE